MWVFSRLTPKQQAQFLLDINEEERLKILRHIKRYVNLAFCPDGVSEPDYQMAQVNILVSEKEIPDPIGSATTATRPANLPTTRAPVPRKVRATYKKNDANPKPFNKPNTAREVDNLTNINPNARTYIRPIVPRYGKIITHTDRFPPDPRAAIRDTDDLSPFGTLPGAKLPSIMETNEEELAAKENKGTMAKRGKMGAAKKKSAK